MEQGRKRLRSSEDKTYVSACERKNKYKTEAKARAWGQLQVRKGTTPAGRLWVYPCPCCRQWHLTKSQTNTPAITADQKREGFL